MSSDRELEIEDAHAAGVAVGREQVLDVVQRIRDRAQRECVELKDSLEHNDKRFLASALADASLEAVTILHTCEDILRACNASPATPPAYVPPTVADLARVQMGGGGETIDPAYRTTAEEA